MSAEEDFLGRVEEVARLLDEIDPGWWPDRSEGIVESRKLATPIRVLARSSLVLLVSYFEGFLKDLTDEAFDHLVSSGLTCEQLGDDFRGQLIGKHVRNLRAANEPRLQWVAASEMLRLVAVLSEASPVTNDLVPREEVKKAVSSIDPGKINALLRALNDQDLKTGPMSKHADKLRMLKRIRDSAVHGNEADLPPLGYREVYEGLELLTSCARDLQSRVDQLLER